MDYLKFKTTLFPLSLFLMLTFGIQAQTTYSGIIRHTNSYLTINPYNSSYDDGTHARLFYDGNNHLIQFWNSAGASVPYTHISAGNLTANGDITSTGKLSTTGNISTLASLGIGTSTPQSKLHIAKGGQNIRFATGDNTSSYSLEVGINDDGVNFTNSSGYRGFNFTNQNGNLLSISRFGDIGIGTTITDSKLTVNGRIHAEEVKIDLSVPAPDYVFKEGYTLRTLDEIQDYINEHGHLPNIPSAKEMEQNGVELGIMNMKLLEKIEELTLYIIHQEKQADRFNKENQRLEQRVDSLEALMLKVLEAHK